MPPRLPDPGFRMRLAVASAALAVSCRGEKPAVLLLSPVPAAYVDAAAEKPQMRFGDGTVSLNDHCPIRKRKLNPKMPPVYVNGRPIGFC